MDLVLIWGSIGCALATKFGGEVGAHEISNTQKGFGQILNNSGDIKIINIFNGVPKSKLRKIKILMGINKDKDEKLPKDKDQVYFNLSR